MITLREFYDAVIVGGGPAGLATAIVLGKENLSVLLIDRRNLPADKPCGEGLLPPGLKILHDLGVNIPEHMCHPIRGIRYISGNIQAQAEFKEGSGRGIRRTVLSAALLARANEFENVQILSPARAEFPSGLDHFDGTVRISQNNSSAICRTNLIIGADGLHSEIRRLAKLERPGRAKTRFGLRKHFQSNHTLDDFVTVFVDKGSEAYLTPVGQDSFGVAILFSRNEDTRSGKEEAFEALRNRFPGLVPLTQTSAGEQGGAGPLEQRTTGVARDGVILVGDAAGYLDAATGEGISLALATAQSTARLAQMLRKSNKPLNRLQLSGYEKDHHRITWNYFVMTKMLLFMSDHPTLARPFIRIMAVRPRSFQALLSFNMGEPLFPVLRRFIAGLFRK